MRILISIIRFLVDTPQHYNNVVRRFGLGLAFIIHAGHSHWASDTAHIAKPSRLPAVSIQQFQSARGGVISAAWYVGVECVHLIYDEPKTHVVEVQVTGRDSLNALHELSRECRLPEIVAIYHTDLRGVDLSFLGMCSKTRTLRISNCHLDDDTLKWKDWPRSLREISLWQSLNVDRNLRHISSRPGIISIGLSSSDVSDSGLMAISTMKGLKNVALFGTSVTEFGIESIIPAFATGEYATLQLDHIDSLADLKYEVLLRWRRMAPDLDIYCDGR